MALLVLINRTAKPVGFFVTEFHLHIYLSHLARIDNLRLDNSSELQAYLHTHKDERGKDTPHKSLDHYILITLAIWFFIIHSAEKQNKNKTQWNLFFYSLFEV
jgi:hypothetical protein